MGMFHCLLRLPFFHLSNTPPPPPPNKLISIKQEVACKTFSIVVLLMDLFSEWCPTNACSQNGAPQTPVLRMVPHKRLFSEWCPTNACSKNGALQTPVLRMVPHKRLFSEWCPTNACSQNGAPQTPSTIV